MKASIRLTEAVKKLNDKIDNIKIEKPKDGKNGLNGVNGKDGVGIKKIEIKDNHLIITLTNNKKLDLGVVIGKDGVSGRNGRDATINGVNTLTIEAGDNISIEQDDDTLTISSIASGLKIVVVQELPETGATDTFYLVPKTTSQTNNIYDEYIYNNGWELIGTTEIDLTDYVKNTDYASGSKGGVFKTSSNFATTVTSGGYLVNGAKTYNEYQNANVNMFVSKGTLDNVIAGKGLVSNTDYANNSTGGVIKTASNYATTMTQNGELQATSLPYQSYRLSSNSMFISKGTLENVISGKRLVSGNDYDFYKLDYIDESGDGSYFLADDGAYYPIPADIRIPNITIKCIVKNEEKYLRLVFGAYSKAFEGYVKQNGISIHLLRYKNCSNRVWGQEKKTNEKKWIHPANDVIIGKPDRQCWGFANYRTMISDNDYFDAINNAEYYIDNDGMVQSEFTLTYADFKRGYLDINVRDLMSCIVKEHGAVQPGDTDMHIPYEGGAVVKIMGTRTSPRRKRVRQPIKYVFALPIRISSDRIKYQYGTSNEAILELMTLRDQQAMTCYRSGDKLLNDIGFGVLIK